MFYFFSNFMYKLLILLLVCIHIVSGLLALMLLNKLTNFQFSKISENQLQL